MKVQNPSALKNLGVKKETPLERNKSLEKNVARPSRLSLSESKSIALGTNLKRKSRNSINALLDAQLFTPDVVTVKQAVTAADDDDTSDDEDVLSKSGVSQKQQANKKDYLKPSERKINPGEERNCPNIVNRPALSGASESLVKSNRKEWLANWEPSSTISARGGSGASFVVEDIDKDVAELTAGRLTRSKSVVGVPVSGKGRKSYVARLESERGAKLTQNVVKETKSAKKATQAIQPLNTKDRVTPTLQTRDGEPAKTAIKAGTEMAELSSEKVIVNPSNRQMKIVIKDTKLPINETVRATAKSNEVVKAVIKNEESNEKPSGTKVFEENPGSVGARHSNSMTDAVQVRCRVCGQSVTMTRMRSHTKSAHKMNIRDYKSKFGNLRAGILETVLHTCGLCQQDILLDSDEIMMHLKRSHTITHKHYNQQFMRMSRAQNTCNKLEPKSGKIADFQTVKTTQQIDTSSSPSSEPHDKALEIKENQKPETKSDFFNRAETTTLKDKDYESMKANHHNLLKVKAPISFDLTKLEKSKISNLSLKLEKDFEKVHNDSNAKSADKQVSPKLKENVNETKIRICKNTIPAPLPREIRKTPPKICPVLPKVNEATNKSLHPARSKLRLSTGSPLANVTTARSSNSMQSKTSKQEVKVDDMLAHEMKAESVVTKETENNKECVKDEHEQNEEMTKQNTEDDRDEVMIVEEIEVLSKHDREELQAIEDSITNSFGMDELFDSDEDSSDEE